MKKTLLFIFCFSLAPIFGQVTNEGQPASWDLVEKKSILSPIHLPEMDYARLQAKVNSEAKAINKPYRFGYKHRVNYNFNNAGVWTNLENGDRIWRVLFESKDASSLNFIFKDYHLPIGAKIYLYNDDRSELLGAYTHTQNNASGQMATWIVNGDSVWIEYLEPEGVRGQGNFTISDITHGFKKVDKNGSILGESGDCNHDVDCPIGSDFSDHRDILKKAVVLILVQLPDDSFVDWCTGTLINNTSNDKTPYILTANHCLFDNDDQPLVNPSSFSFRFNWISPNPVCASNSASADNPVNLSISGASLVANNSSSDFALLKLNGAIPSDWDVNYAGWDRTDVAPPFVVGIHHPQGDIMKISRDDSGVIKFSHSIDGGPVAQTWDITTAGGGWELGVTEIGSSGSALFDDQGKIIGQLFGGGASCTGFNDNGQLDFYGRFGVSWAAGPSESSRLRDWLDPNNSGVTSLEFLSNTLSVADEELAGNIKIFPNPTNGVLRVEINNRIGEYNYEIFNVLGQSIKKAKLTDQRVELTTLPSAMYFVKITENETQKFAVKKVLLNK